MWPAPVPDVRIGVAGKDAPTAARKTYVTEVGRSQAGG